MNPCFSLQQRLFALLAVVAAASGLRAQVVPSAPFTPNDPYFGPNLSIAYSGQWYLRNQAPAQMNISYSLNGTPVPIHAVNIGLDANLTPAWQRGVTGRGVVIGIIGVTGLQGDHPDLAPGYRADLSAQYSLDPAISSQPQGPLSPQDNHDTAVAGIAVARGGNGIGMAGAAPLASLAGFRLDDPTNTPSPTSSPNYVAANYAFSGVASTGQITGYAEVPVRNRSYARIVPFTVEDPRYIESLDQTADNNVVNVFAAGNFRGSPMADTGRMQGNSLVSAIAVAALGSNGKFADYSNYGASVFVTAPGARLDATGLLAPSVDRTGVLGYDPGTSIGDPFPDHNYTSIFNGTSGAAPIVSGIVALGKELNPFLDVRAAKHAFAVTSRVVDPTDASTTGHWQTNGAGLRFNPNYGFGLVDAAAFVNKVEQIAFVTAPQAFATGPLAPSTANRTLSATAKTESLTLTAAAFATAGVNRLPLESVDVTLDVTSANRDALQGTLTSPAGTTSTFMTASNQLSGYNPAFDDPTPAAGLQWTFSANNFWGEDPFGTWNLSLSDLANNGSTWNSYALTFHLGQMVLESGSLAIATATTAHSAVLDYATTAMSIASNATFSVRDEFWVNNGTLRVDGRLENFAAAGLARSRLVLNGGRLTGTGTIATSLGVMNAAGTVRPGDAGVVGTLTIAGNYTQQASGAFEVDLASNTQVDALVVRQGTAALAGTLRVNVLPGADIVAGPIAPIVRTEAGGTVTGTFTTIEGTRVRPTLLLRRAAPAANIYSLEAYRDYLVADVSATFTTAERELATYLNAAAARSAAPYENLLRAIDRQTTVADAATAIRAIAPFSPGVAATVALASDSSRLDTVLRHAHADVDSQPGLFVETSYADADIDPTTRRPGYGYSDRGLLAGYGFDLGGKLSAGFFLGASDSRARLDLTQSKLDGDHRAFGVHALWSNTLLRLAAALQYGWGDFTRSRVVMFPGTSEEIRSDSETRQWSAVFEAARHFNAGLFSHQIFGNLRLQSAKIGGYTEPGAFGWTVDRQRERSTLGQIGYEISHSIALNGVALRPFASLTYAHEFESGDHELTARLSGDTTNSLQLHTERADGDYASFQAGAALRFTSGFQLYGLGVVDLGQSDASRYSLHLGLRNQF